jgi:hypothetical protein
MSPVSYVLTVLAAASLAVGIAVPSCDPSKAPLAQCLPANQTAVTAPTDPISFALLGVGYQNYTCNAAGTFDSAGATADLFDVSCIVKTPQTAASIATMSFNLWTRCSKISDLVVPALGAKTVVGKHYFGTSPSGTGISPIWDMRSSGTAKTKGNPDAFVLAAKSGSVPAPTDPTKDVPWLQLAKVQGKLANTVYRTDTRGGPAPATCTPGFDKG